MLRSAYQNTLLKFFPGSQIIVGSLCTLSLSMAFGSNLILEGNPATNHMAIRLENISTGLLPALAITIVDNHTPVVKQSSLKITRVIQLIEEAPQ